MKLTVSSIAMMNPVLHTHRHRPCKPPQRVLGLLEFTQLNLDQNSGTNIGPLYHRPDQQHGLALTANEQNLLKLSNANKQARIAVFGFKFNGGRAWYQVWDCASDRTCWLLDNEDLNYEPFAILAMDAMVSLLPNWDGLLHPSPDVANHPTAVECRAPDKFDTRRIHSLFISDSITTETGVLWFLVTVSLTGDKLDGPEHMLASRSGWIAPIV